MPDKQTTNKTLDIFEITTRTKTDTTDTGTDLSIGQVWRSSKTWWCLVWVDAGRAWVEGPRGSVRSSRDGGKTWSDPFTIMTRSGFEAWIRKSGAVLS